MDLVVILAAVSVARPFTLPSSPCVGAAASCTRELVVVGTAHAPCRSAAEVKAIINRTKPDVVVVELDQERLERLLASPRDARRYGADLAAATEAAAALGVPIVLGDAKARDIKAALRTPGPVVNGQRVARAVRLAVRVSKRGGSPDGQFSLRRVSVVRALLDDPAKLLPLLAGFWWTVLLTVLWTAVRANAATPAAFESDVATGVSEVSALALVALCVRVADELLLRRDEVLAASALRGLELAHGLRSRTLLRRRYRFGTDPEKLAAADGTPAGHTPFFTLQRPLAKGELRRLNLFEPRWLCLLDSLAAPPEAGASDADGESEHPLLHASFGCAFAVNRYYAPADRAAWDADADSTGERIADVVLLPTARRVRIERVEEGVRPVSGARRLTVYIRGEDAMRIDESTLRETGGGYLAARTEPCEEQPLEASSLSRGAHTKGGAEDQDVNQDAASAPLRVVSVVGLAHANGVLDRCVERELCDERALLRAASEESDWVGY